MAPLDASTVMGAAGRWPMATTTASAAMPNSLPTSGTGWRRPSGPGSPRTARMHSRATTRPADRTTRSGMVSSASATPSASVASTSSAMAGISLAGAAVYQGDLFGAKPLDGARGVHRRVSAAHHQHAAPDGPGLFALFHLAAHLVQQVQGIAGAGALLAGDAQGDALGRAGGDVDGGVALGQERRGVRRRGVQHEPDAQGADALEVGLQGPGRQAEGRDGPGQQPARAVPRLQDGDGDAVEGQDAGGRQS